MPVSDAVTGPAVAIGVGTTGRRVVEELLDTATTRPGGDRFATCALADGARGEVGLRRDLTAALARLLQAGRLREGLASLDLLVVADAADGDLAGVQAACRAATGVLADEYGVLFPAAAPVQERSAWLVAVVATPALTRAGAGERVLDGLAALEAWADAEAPHPALSRVFVLPRQSTAGSLSDLAVEASLRLFVQALVLSGARDHDAIRALVQHRADGRRLATFALAAAELPVARLRRYARWRAAWDGLSTLVELAEHPATDAARARGLLARLDVDALLEPFEEGDAAQRLRRHAAALSGATDRLPSRHTVGLAEPADAVVSRFRTLFDPAAKTPPEWGTTSPDHEDLVRLLDQVEADAADTCTRRLRGLLDTELDPETALEVLPDLESALERAEHDLRQQLRPDPPELPAPEPPPPPRDLGLEQLQAALHGRPQPLRLLPVAAAIALVIGTAAAVGVLAAFGGGAPAVDTTAVIGIDTTADAVGTGPVAWLPGLVGVLVGLAVAVTWVVVLLHQARRRLERRLRDRTHDLEESWRRGGVGQTGHQAAAALAVRKRRTVATLTAAVTRAQARTSAMRAALRHARARASAELDRLAVRLGSSQGRDDLSALLGEEGPLHASLLPPELIATRIAASRTARDDTRWARSLLRATWPQDGIQSDLPALDEQRLAEVCDAQHDGLAGAALLDGPEIRPIAEQRVASFLRRSGDALAWGIRPIGHHGDPVIGTGADRRLVIAPPDLRGGVDIGLEGRTARHVRVPACPGTPWVLVIGAWQAFRVDEIRRGTGVDRD